MTDPTAPIGVFDSGVGGLTVARALLHLLPGERLLYFADTAHVPYGPRPPEQIKDFALDISAFLIEQGAKAVIMGCNTSSAVALEPARESHGPLIFGVIQPGAKAALRATRKSRIGVIATQATVSTAAYSSALRGLKPALEVIEQPCPEFVPLVEKGELNSAHTRQVTNGYLEPVLQFGVDTVVLGCTQYPLLRPLIQEIAGPEITLIDPAEETAKEVAAALREAKLVNPGTPDASAHRFFASGDPTSIKTVGARFLGQPIENIESASLWK
ncbi:MAG: glutamate racemase [Armatimonadetes bacterium]|nr:glutamate racemase [Armatimonadota bacterium]NIM77116.1 glutamate racemase [Armatimonadota bacterium]NIO75022.1 glutamate racemase [Armatimonadota bacterium]